MSEYIELKGCICLQTNSGKILPRDLAMAIDELNNYKARAEEAEAKNEKVRESIGKAVNLMQSGIKTVRKQERPAGEMTITMLQHFLSILDSDPDSEHPDGCKCQGCGAYYTVDMSVPNEIWEKITLKKGGGLLCPGCICIKLVEVCGATAVNAYPDNYEHPDNVQLVKMAKFLRNTIRSSSWGIDVDGGNLQDRAVEAGYLVDVKVTEDNKDTFTDECEVGETAYQFSGDLAIDADKDNAEPPYNPEDPLERADAVIGHNVSGCESIYIGS